MKKMNDENKLFQIRRYQKEDYPMIYRWYLAANMSGPDEEIIPQSTYLVFIKAIPAACLSLILTNARIGWMENLVGNPDLKTTERKHAIDYLAAYVEVLGKSLGLKRFFLMSQKRSSTRRYAGLGYEISARDITTMTKEIE